jgi:hypothetical protein
MKKLSFYLALFLCANFASSFQLPSLQDSFFLLVLGLVFIPVWACPPPPDLGSPDTEFFHCSSPPFGSRFPLANFPKHLFPLVFDLSRTSFTAPWFSSVFGPHAACLGPVCVSSSIPAPVFRLHVLCLSWPLTSSLSLPRFCFMSWFWCRFPLTTGALDLLSRPARSCPKACGQGIFSFPA